MHQSTQTKPWIKTALGEYLKIDAIVELTCTFLPFYINLEKVRPEFVIFDRNMDFEFKPSGKTIWQENRSRYYCIKNKNRKN